MKTKKPTNLMGTTYYKNNSPHLQDEINNVTNLYLKGLEIVDLARVYELSKTKCFNYIKTGLENYQTNRTSGKHLSYSDRRYIEFESRIGKSNRAIAKALGCHPSTIANELKRINGNFYNADKAQKDYKTKNSNWQKPYKLKQCEPFLKSFSRRLKERKESAYSFCQAVRNGVVDGLDKDGSYVSPQTLYNWINSGLIDNISIKDLPYYSRRKKEEPFDFKKEDGKHTPGNSIDFRPDIPVDENGNVCEFGHFELDCLLGVKDKTEPALLVLTERMTRFTIVRILDRKSAENVNKAMVEIKESLGSKWPEIFRTITTDNGSEFLKLHKVKGLKKRIYYCHPGCPKEKPLVERTNAMIRVYIPKGTRISNFSSEDIDFITECINSKHRAVLNGSNAESLFDAELDRLYAA